MSALRVGIIGAGLGGLCLAQGLARAGIHVDIYERHMKSAVRGQGYRLRIDPDGQRALATCMSPENYRLFRQSSAQVTGAGRFVDPLLQPLSERRPENWKPSAGTRKDELEGDLSVNRLTLREILCDGLVGQIHWGHAFREYKVMPDGIELTFAQGETQQVDLLVAADGVHSPVRRQFLPQAEPDDLGAITIYGKTPLAEDLRSKLDNQLLQGVTAVFADGFSLIIEPMQFRAGMHELAAAYAPHCELTPVDDYLYWAFIGPSEHLGGALADQEAREQRLAYRIRDITSDWHAQLQAIFDHRDPSALSARPVLMAPSLPTWEAGAITLLGDAIHAMSPAGGLGANTALCDASVLAEKLAGAARGGESLTEAVRAYESNMRTRAACSLLVSREGSERLFRRL
jgi:salicylate hydroxylase